jgi:transposase
MAFVRKIKTKSGTYLAEVENKWINGKVVQKHIRYVGKSPSKKNIHLKLDNIEIKKVKSFGDLFVINQIAQELNLNNILGDYSKEILSLTYSHIIDPQPIYKIENWFNRTDLNKILDLNNISEKQLHSALESISEDEIIKKIIKHLRKEFSKYLSNNVLIYDLTDTYFTTTKNDFGKKKRGKDGKYASLIQLGLVVDKNEGFPLTYKMYNGNIADRSTIDDILIDLEEFKFKEICLVLDRGFFSIKNIEQINKAKHKVILGISSNPKLKKLAKENKKEIISLKNRVKLNKTTFYVEKIPYQFGEVNGNLFLVFNNKKEVKEREELYDKLDEMKELLLENKKIPDKMQPFFLKSNEIDQKYLNEYLASIGFSYIFSTKDLSSTELVKTYFDKDIVEKSFRTIKGVLNLRPIKFWLKRKVKAHLLICYISYAILSLLKYKLKSLNMTPSYVLDKLKTAYKVDLIDNKENISTQKIITLSKEQEKILKLLDTKI